MDMEPDFDELLSYLDEQIPVLDNEILNFSEANVAPITNCSMGEENVSFFSGELLDSNEVSSVMNQPDAPTLDTTYFDMSTFGPPDCPSIPVFIIDEVSSSQQNVSSHQPPSQSNIGNPCILTQAIQDSIPTTYLLNDSELVVAAPQQCLELNQVTAMAPTQVLDQGVKYSKKGGKKPIKQTRVNPYQRPQQKKKVYEQPPSQDKEEERKRKNAVNAKNNREKTKQKINGLEQSLAEMTRDRDQLKLRLAEVIRERDQLLMKSQ